MAGHVIGTVKSAQGVVDVRSADGKIRSLLVGDAVREGDTVLTTGGGQLVIGLVAGGELVLGPGEALVVTAELSADRYPGADESQVASVDNILAALQEGKDLSTLLEATAAGPAGGPGTNEGHTFVQLLRVVENVGEVSFQTSAPVDSRPQDIETNYLIPEQPNGPPSVVIGPGDTDDTSEESGLPGGSGNDPNAVDAGGQFQVSDPDGIEDIVSITITYTNPEGQQTSVTIPIGDLQGTVLQTNAGQLTITNYNPQTGVATYEYVLTTPTTDGPGTETDDFTVTVSDGESSSGPAVISIEIIDDVPTAVNDAASITEDAVPNTASGNVLTNDVSGADAPASLQSWGSETAQYGSIVKNPDGTYTYTLDNTNPAVQALGPNQTLTETFSYTMKDADGDTSTASLTITINGADDGVTITGIGNTAGDETVNENDLPGGSSPDAAALTQTGSFAITAPDGIGSVQVGGTTITFTQLQNLGTTPVTIDTPNGQITLTGYTGSSTDGTISYSYTLQQTVDNDSQAGATNTGYVESIPVGVTDSDGSTGSSSLNIAINDDVPSATNDTASVTEDAVPNTASGNVLTNDVAGADAPASLESWGPETAQYGSITKNPDGTYTYTLDNTNPAVQALSAGETLTETFTYTMKDADGDTSSASLTITVNGADDGVTITGIGNAAGDETVNENDLPGGSSPNAAALTQTGSFAITALDGIGSVQVGGTTLSLSQLQNLGTTPVTIDTPNGALTLNGYSGNAQGGTVSYSYTLDTTVDNDSQAGATNTGYVESVPVTVTDSDGSVGNSSLNIAIADDVPGAVNDTASVTEDAVPNTASGNVLTNDVAGADAPKTLSSWGSETAQYGSMVKNADGSYTYTLNNSLPAVQALGANQTLTETFTYTMKDADGDTSTATLTITINGANDGASVTTSAAGTAPDSTVLEHGLTSVGDTTETTTGSFQVSASDGIANVVIGGTVFTLAQVQAFNGTQTVNTGQGVLTLTGYTGTANSGTITYSYTLSATIDNDSIVPTGNDAVTGAHFDDNVLLTVNGTGGTTGSDNLVIRAIDDTPSAVNDTASITEDAAPNTASGNVLNNDAAGADAPKTLSSWGSETAQYGSMVKNADGSYTYTLNNSLPAVQALNQGQTLTETFTYTMKDADGDTSTATLTITINGANDSASVSTSAAGTAPDATVLEHGLTSAGDTSETIGGVFQVSATDGIASVVIGGTSYTLAQVQAFNGTQTVNTGQGVLTLLSYTGTAAGGTIAYSYTLSATIDNDSIVPTGNDAVTGAHFDDSVALTVNGVGGTTASDNLVIRAIDDTPSAVNDTASITEDAVPNTASGNVLNNDAAGADAPKTLSSWGSETAQYGSMVKNADGSYTYTLNNSLPAVQALAAGQTLTETFTYTMKDADGDTSTATLTITINGAADGASVTTAAAGSAPDSTVFEHGLTSVGDTTETTTGSFQVSASDGIANVVIGGTVFTLAQVQAFNGTQTVNTGQGVLTLTGYTGTANSGTITYSYTLSATIDNDSITPTGNDAVTGAHFDDSVALTVNGVGGTTGSDNLVIRAIDDTPTATADGPVGVVEDGASNLSGNVLTNDSAGADAPAVFVGWGADTAAIAALNTYGTLVQNANGSWTYVLDNSRAATQALTSAFDQNFVLNYTMKDQDGDTSSSTLTINIKGANDGASVTTSAAGTAPDSTVYEHGLTSAGDTTETTTGSFQVSASDGIANVVIGGTVFTLAQVQAFNGTQTVNTGQGVLTLTGYTGTATGGTISYSYTLSTTIDNDSITPTGNDAVTGAHFDDSVALTVNGIGGTTGSDNLVIRAIDDTPTATADGPVGVVEDGASNLSGNVLTNDSAGADAPAVFVSWGADTAAIAALNTYGTLVQNANGSWTYVLDNSRAATQALTSAFDQNFVLNYTMKDQDGDTSSSTLTINIKGANDGASVTTTVAGSAPDHTVYESGLNPNGSNAAANTETVTGSFQVSASDGIANVVIGGTIFTLAQVQAFNGTQTVNTGQGVLTLTGYTGTANSGTISYSYTLSATIDNDSIVPTGNDAVTLAHFDDSVALTVNGVGGTTAGDSLVIRAIDDAPSLSAGNIAIANVAGTFSGPLTFVSGADVQSFGTSFGSNALTWTNPRAGFSYSYNAATDVGTATFVENGVTKTFFTVKLNANGTYDFNLVTPDPVTIQTIPSLLTTITGGNGQPSFTIPASNFGGQFALVLTGRSDAHPNDETINLSSASVGVGDDVMHGSKGDILRFDVQPVNGSDATPTSLTVTVDGTAGWKANDQVDLVIKYVGEPAVTSVQTWGSDASVTFALDPSKTVDYMELKPHDASASFKINGVAMSYEVPSFPSDYQLNFTATGSDADGDTASANFTVAVNTATSGAYSIDGTASADVIYNTSGSDTLIGMGGADTFVWRLADKGGLGTPKVDTVSDFGNGGTDRLDLRDLLQGENKADLSNLDNYLHFTQSGGTTTVHISSSGGFSGGFSAGATDQQIQLTGVDLTALGNDQQIIQNLLTNGKLVTD